MKSFKDLAGRDWHVHFTVAAFCRARELFNIVLGIPMQGEPTVGDLLMNDPGFQGQVLYAVCKTQADGMGLSREQFFDLLEPEVIANASTVLLSEYIDFFRRAGRKAETSVLHGALLARERLMTDALSENEVAERIISLLATASGEQSAAPQESSESPIPADGPSAT